MNSTMKRPLISVIMSVYNDSQYVKSAIDSILNQTVSDFELIITDDCSTDDTVNIISAIKDDRILLIQNTENRGLTKNLNSMLEIAKGEFIARMDGDDISLPNRFKKQLEYFDRHKETELIGSDSRNIGASDLIWRCRAGSEELKCRLLLRPIFAHPSFMMRRSLIEAGLRYDEDFRTAQDYDFCRRVAKEHAIGRVNSILLCYRVHDKQVSGTAKKGQSHNAERIRRELLNELGLSFSDKDLELFNCFSAEKNPGEGGYENARKLIDKICEANKNKSIYDEKILEKTLKKLFYTWIIRSEKGKSIKYFGMALKNGISEACIFAGELFRTVSEKTANKFVK